MILVTVAAGLALIRRLDREIKPGRKGKPAIVAAAVLGGLLLKWILAPGELLPGLFLEVVLGCLLLACVSRSVPCGALLACTSWSSALWCPAGLHGLVQCFVVPTQDGSRTPSKLSTWPTQGPGPSPIG